MNVLGSDRVREIFSNYPKTKELRNFIEFLEKYGKETNEFYTQLLNDEKDLINFHRGIRNRFLYFNLNYSIFNQYNSLKSDLSEQDAWFMKKRMSTYFLHHKSFEGLFSLQKSIQVNSLEAYRAFFGGTNLFQAEGLETAVASVIIKDSIGKVIFYDAYHFDNCPRIQAQYSALLYLLLTALIIG